jgi:hypothetical protein
MDLRLELGASKFQLRIWYWTPTMGNLSLQAGRGGDTGLESGKRVRSVATD